MGKFQKSKIPSVFYVSLLPCLVRLCKYSFIEITVFPEPIKRTLSAEQSPTPTANINCFEQFRQNNCNLDKPAGTLCQNLHLCMTSKKENMEIATIISSTPKLANI
jgi:hypothetical protein